MMIPSADDLSLSVSSPERLEAVEATGLLDSPMEESFDRLTRLAAKLIGAPVTFVSVVAAGRDFYKSCFGFPEPLATVRELKGTTFCHYALMSKGPLIIENTLDNPIYRNVPTVESLGVRAYLGVPLIDDSGQALGSFCAIDFKPRHWTPLDVEVMQELSASTLREIELRSALEKLRGSEERFRAAAGAASDVIWS
ncbi:MAG TPA: GAF domain-containing protein [Thermoanaerobaculia bacterium]|nr:GAF domain-containing protein [Thermoanaerobaculia bacterium]